MRQEVLAAIVALLVVGSLGAGYEAGVGQRTTKTVTTVITTAITTTTTVTVGRTTVWLSNTTVTATSPLPNTPSGLSLRIVVNGTTIGVGEALAITAIVFNPLPQNDNLSTSTDWPFHGLFMYNQNWPPCGYYPPFEVTVLAGNYSVSQLRSTGTEAVLGAACMESTTYTGFNFLTESNMVNVTGMYSEAAGPEVFGPVNASVTVTTNGYWDNSSSIAYPPAYGSSEYDFVAAQHSFVPGVYTIAVGDEWGELVVIHLTVV
jgi:hypothetical protein